MLSDWIRDCASAGIFCAGRPNKCRAAIALYFFKMVEYYQFFIQVYAMNDEMQCAYDVSESCIDPNNLVQNDAYAQKMEESIVTSLFRLKNMNTFGRKLGDTQTLMADIQMLSELFCLRANIYRAFSETIYDKCLREKLDTRIALLAKFEQKMQNLLVYLDENEFIWTCTDFHKNCHTIEDMISSYYLKPQPMCTRLRAARIAEINSR